MSIFGFLLTDSQLSRLYSKYGRQTFRLLASIRYMTHTHSLCTITATIMEFKTQFSMKYFRIPAGIDAIRIMFRDASISFFYCCSAVAIIPYFFFIFRLFLPWLLFFFSAAKTSSLSLLCTCFTISYALVYFKISTFHTHIWAYENLMHGNPVWYTCYILTRHTRPENTWWVVGFFFVVRFD